MRDRPLTYIRLYATTEQASLLNKEGFYEKVAHQLELIKASDIVVLIGKHAKVEIANGGFEWVMSN